MADTATGIVGKTEHEYLTKVEDIAPATKKVTVEISAERIAEKLVENLGEIRVKAALPGFRVGHAPQKLVEKRFGADVRNDVQRQLVSESYQQSLEKNKLDVVGEPEFDNPEAIKLPESGPLSYSFQVEVRPTFEMPELKDVPVKRTKVALKDEHLEQAMKNLREQQGSIVPVEDRGIEANDYVTADVSMKLDGNEIAGRKDFQFIVKASPIMGILIDDLEKQLAGLKAGESKTINVKAPEGYNQEEIRGKDVVVEFAVKGIKRLQLAEINEEFLESLGFTDEQELKDALKEQMEIRVKSDVQQSMRDQVVKYVMDKVQLEVPAKMSARQAERIIQRRASDLMMRGIAAEEIQANIEKIKAGADEQAAAELKSFFVLDKLAEMQNVDVSESELNNQVSMIAMQMGERPEKLKQRLAKDGSLQSMFIRLRENKAVDKILENAKIEEVEVEEKKDEKKA